MEALTAGGYIDVRFVQRVSTAAQHPPMLQKMNHCEPSSMESCTTLARRARKTSFDLSIRVQLTVAEHGWFVRPSTYIAVASGRMTQVIQVNE